MKCRISITVVLMALCLVGMMALWQGCAQRLAYTTGNFHPAALHGADKAAQRRDVAGVDELWVIAKRDDARGESAADDVPGSGALMAKVANEKEPVPVPLKHTDVKADILGYIATVDVTQQYHNPFSEKIEAVYVFPLPHNAAINEFLMTIGERKIRGIIRERLEAEKIYQEARAQGYVASLLTQERPNIFTQAVANIEPGKEIDINIRYFQTLSYADGYYEWHFPMVVGPRFNPPYQKDGVGAVGRGAQGMSGQTTEVQYLKPSERSGHDISLAVHLNAGVAIETIESINHRFDLKKERPERARITLAEEDRIANKDFVLRYRVAGETIKTAVFTQRDKTGSYFTLMLYPPKDLGALPRQPLEMVFTLDVSGSMTGQPIEQSRAAIRYALRHMRPDDTFQIIRFANGADKFADRPAPATPENLRSAMRFIESTSAGGGTYMIDGIRGSLNFPHDESRLRFVSFLTDGYIGNEREILAEVRKSLGPSRIFSFGVGSSPNRYLLDHMAKLGNGAVAYLSLNEKADEVMELFFNRIAHPAMTDLAIDFGKIKVTDVYPQRVPDLFVGRPVILTGRFSGEGQTTIKVRGKVGNEMQEIRIPVNLDEDAAKHAGIAAVWARAKIADLDDRSIDEDNADLPNQIKQTALQFGLMSPYTAFIAVDATRRTEGDHGTSVSVPVPVPEGVRYETTVGE